MKLTKSQTALLNADLNQKAIDYALPYRELANQIGLIAAQKAALTNGVNEANYGLWDGFKKGLDVAIAADHSPTAIRVGFAVACEQAGIPAGSFRSYVATIGNMYADIQAGTLEREAALLMKVKDARERYQDADKKALREAKARLEASTKDWTVAQLDELTEYAGLINEERKAQADAALEALAQERQAIAA